VAEFEASGVNARRVGAVGSWVKPRAHCEGIDAVDRTYDRSENDAQGEQERVGYREKLPAACPPEAAHDMACNEAYRLLPSASALTDHFESLAAKGIPMPPGMDPCRWASCSLCCDMETVRKKRKLKNLRKYTHVASMKIAVGSGMLLIRGGHIDFWMYDTFDPISAIVRVTGL
jgi:hypothetical protein